MTGEFTEGLTVIGLTAAGGAINVAGKRRLILATRRRPMDVHGRR